MVRANLRRQCKCHGLSGNCEFSTCWKQLAPFKVVGSELKQRYFNAVQVSFKEGRLQEKAKSGYKAVSPRDKKLVYLQASPDYCVRNLTAGSFGMRGRKCSSNDLSGNECSALCNACKLKHKTSISYTQVKCRCKFVWCCSVKCDTCARTSLVTTCTTS